MVMNMDMDTHAVHALMLVTLLNRMLSNAWCSNHRGQIVSLVLGFLREARVMSVVKPFALDMPT